MVDLQNSRVAVDWLRSRVRGDLEVDSRCIGSGDGFIAWPGAANDGRQFVAEAVSRGAAACLVEHDGAERFGFTGDAIASLNGLKEATGPLAAAWYRQPTETLDLLAVTGTNGKTSTVWWLAQALSGLSGNQQLPTAMMGTLGVGRVTGPDSAPLVETGLTTPDPVTMQRWFRRLSDAGLSACAIEASSIGLAEKRIEGSRIRVAIFTNFSQDHLDYHGSMDAYWQSKAGLFRWPGLEAAVVNIDDAHGAGLASSIAGSALDLWTVSCTQSARLQAREIELHPEGLRFTVAEGAQSQYLETTLIGSYNASNLLGVIGTMRALGVPLESAVQACNSLAPVPGRMERHGAPGEPLVVVDYAHTPDALAQVLSALLPLARARGGQLFCVFGCGGDRDRTKRAPMAAAAERLADQIVITSDNPRLEDPRAIIDQMVEGLARPDHAIVVRDRERAITDTIASADAADVVCIAGKGHEAYQEINGIRHPFSDSAQARRALGQRSDAGRGVRACQ